MIVLHYGEQIKESEEELLALERKQTKRLLRLRVRFLRLLKSGACTTQIQAGEQIGLDLRQSQRVWEKYKHEGINAVLTYPYKGHKPRITPGQEQALKDELEKDQIQSLQQACDFMEQKLGAHFSPSGMHYIFKRLKIKKKTGRPVHHHRDDKGAEELKKNSSPKAGL